jgi:DNA polymerase delta subunit 1
MCDTNCSREELIAKVDKIGTEMGEFCTQAFLPPNDLEYEKFYYPILLKGKKRYAGHKFEPGLAPKLDVKGFECVRRDFAPIVSKTQKKILIKLCKENDVAGAIAYAREVVVKLLRNEVLIEDLTMSKQLTRKPSEYKNPMPHTELAKRLQATQPAHIAPKTGDRIDFLIRPAFKGEKTCMRAVSPEDVREGRATADTRWYLSNQLQKPLQRIFEMIMENSSEIFEISEVHQSQVVANDTMRSFIQRTSAHKRPKRTTAQIERQPKKKKKLTTMNIAAFFK